MSALRQQRTFVRHSLVSRGAIRAPILARSHSNTKLNNFSYGRLCNCDNCLLFNGFDRLDYVSELPDDIIRFFFHNLPFAFA